MGIGHDIFSLTLMSFFALPLFRGTDRLYAGYVLVASCMFIPEALFAWYMLVYANLPGETVYFVPGDPAHDGIMIVTTICVSALLLYLIYFSRRWLNGQADR